MISLKERVCTVYQAKRLKKQFGLELDTYFVWVQFNNEWVVFPRDIAKQFVRESLTIPALDNTEVSVLLPPLVSLKRGTTIFSYGLVTKKYFTFFRSEYQSLIDGEPLLNGGNHRDVSTKTSLLINCLEEGYIPVEDLKL